MTVKEHYDNHLSSFYSWMLGDFDEKRALQEMIFKTNGITPINSKIAIDLGAGNGLQAVPLARLGFTVYALDFNEQLLEELKINSAGLEIVPIKDDIQNIKAFSDYQPELIVCGGDTIAHLDSKPSIETLFKSAYDILPNSGKLYLSFRDYSQELTDTNRFIPVKSDNERILTCFLEYMEERVRVTDILYYKSAAGWEQKISSYFKVRITPDMITRMLEKQGFRITVLIEINRMHHIIAEKK